jgi:hypothetical protein
MPERAARTAQSKFTIGRWSENELILFLDEHQES